MCFVLLDFHVKDIDVFPSSMRRMGVEHTMLKGFCLSRLFGFHRHSAGPDPHCCKCFALKSWRSVRYCQMLRPFLLPLRAGARMNSFTTIKRQVLQQFQKCVLKIMMWLDEVKLNSQWFCVDDQLVNHTISHNNWDALVERNCCKSSISREYGPNASRTIPDIICLCTLGRFVIPFTHCSEQNILSNKASNGLLGYKEAGLSSGWIWQGDWPPCGFEASWPYTLSCLSCLLHTEDWSILTLA